MPPGIFRMESPPSASEAAFKLAAGRVERPFADRSGSNDLSPSAEPAAPCHRHSPRHKARSAPASALPYGHLVGHLVQRRISMEQKWAQTCSKLLESTTLQSPYLQKAKGYELRSLAGSNLVCVFFILARFDGVFTLILSPFLVNSDDLRLRTPAQARRRCS